MNFLPTYTEARGLVKNPAPSWRWVVAMPSSINREIRSNYNYTGGLQAQDSSGFLNTPTVPYGRVQDILLPGLTIDTDPRFGAATKTHYPRFLEVQNTTINFFEDVRYHTLLYLRSWREMVIDKNHNYGVPESPNGYKKTILFFAFGILDNKTPSLIVEIQGAFPTDPGNGLQYEYTQSGMVVIPCNFSVDYVELHWNATREEPRRINAP